MLGLRIMFGDAVETERVQVGRALNHSTDRIRCNQNNNPEICHL